MLATKAKDGQLVTAGSEVEILNWTADGLQFFLGFSATGTYSGLFRLYVQRPTDAEPVCYYAYQTSPSNRTAYLVDRVARFPAGTVISLTVEHDSTVDETFYPTLLGGAN